MARILLRMTSLRAEAVAPDGVRGHKESNRLHVLCRNVSGWDSILISNHWTGGWFPFPWWASRLYPHITTCCLPTQHTGLNVLCVFTGLCYVWFFSLHFTSSVVKSSGCYNHWRFNPNFSFPPWTGKYLGGLFLVKYQTDGMWREALENEWAWSWVVQLIWGRVGPQEVDDLWHFCYVGEILEVILRWDSKIKSVVEAFAIASFVGHYNLLALLAGKVGWAGFCPFRLHSAGACTALHCSQLKWFNWDSAQTGSFNYLMQNVLQTYWIFWCLLS